MFTGIIEETGIIRSILKKEESAEILIVAGIIMQDIKHGDSISVDGVCLTVSHFDKDWFKADAGSETMEITTLKNAGPGKKVNLERALRMNTRMGGHMVSGHVDGIAILKKIIKETGSWKFIFAFPENLVTTVIKKGSVAVNGISLTISGVLNEEVSVSVIPHTYNHTNLSALSTGDSVNIETDVIGKYVISYLRDFISSPVDKVNKSRIDANFLRENGFIG